MDDLIERAEETLALFARPGIEGVWPHLTRELVGELKKIRAENNWLHAEIDRMRVRGDY